ncbi:ABC transporter ATP-binding protein [Actinomyces sp. zg-332]|uniref:ABC transporter ATP-binding protein n=1 Tax=Actinomyces sp. zg-332 TaxID=2708340 RepID=UPI0018E09BD3|nr:ABC transporter ATP-binding protein [Actinomyces sp. zg-332]QPK94360.1 ABC transporter ATP-binding protein [Actinomyces sp. zg-332]
MNEIMIKTNGISKSFENKIALNKVSFEIKEGEIFGFLGPSGAGKTTMINILTGQLSHEKGSAEIMGKDTSKLSPVDLEKIGIVSDQSGYYEKISLYKNLLIYGKLYGVPNSHVEQILKEVRLDESKNVIAEKLSTGMRQRMFLARALINTPKILFLDEPTSGLDPTTSKAIHELLLELKAKGTTIFLTTHDMHEATLLCDNLALLNKGSLIEYGNPRSIIQKYNNSKTLTVTYNDFSEKTISFDDFKTLDTRDIFSIHSCEPTLEDIFIELTGAKLDV